MPISRAGISSNENGFTLVELSVAIFLMALFAFLVVPSVMLVGEDRLTSSARRLAGAVKHYYNEAALSGLRHRLTLHLEEGRYGFAAFEPVGEHLELKPIGDRSLAEGVRFSEVTVAGRGSYRLGEISADIFPVGWMEEMTIHLASGEKEQLTLHVVPLTGVVEIYEGYREI